MNRDEQIEHLHACVRNFKQGYYEFPTLRNPVKYDYAIARGPSF